MGMKAFKPFLEEMSEEEQERLQLKWRTKTNQDLCCA